ncbi:polycystic kidney disease protein 1-like 2 [Exaiptasia diaphana]|uniref:Polycystin domain-containing protein n=1 Tax=Exaiptasia diaphana TaxID=2652724 RepID=A0A913YV59_EXADI|nr:polycystic kidney disease protein 1-like 2 [Exaiptasia diaphana]
MVFEGPEGFLSNREMFLIGMPRLRQLRVKSDNSCLSETPRQLQHFFTSCLQEYNILTEDKTQYSLPGWQRPPIDLDVNSSEELIDNYCPKPWRYSSFKSIQTLPYMGDNVLYGGGGFVADLGYSITTALSVASSLKENNWIDDSTAAVFVEFTVFSPTTMLFSSVKLLFERFPYVATTTSLRINTFNVYPTTNKTFLQLY